MSQLKIFNFNFLDGFRCMHETQKEIIDHPNRYEESTRQIFEALDRCPIASFKCCFLIQAPLTKYLVNFKVRAVLEKHLGK